MKNKTKNYFNYITVFKTTSIFVMLVVLFSIFVTPVFAQQLQTGVEYGTATGLGVQDIRITVMKIIRVILGFLGIVALIIIIYAGWLWMSSAGNAEQIERAKRTLRNAAIGLAIIFSAFSIASFIIGALEGALLGGGPGSAGGPPPACTNCGHLGTGILEAVYPKPFAREVPRNTNIMVTFKVDMDAATIIDGCSSLPCSGNLVSDNVQIFTVNDGPDSRLADNAVVAQTNDGRTFVFNPIEFLGNPITNTWYEVKLTNDIEKDNGQTAFPGAAGSFSWRFEVSTFLDLDPVETSNAFPQPDNASDFYTISSAVPASGAIVVNTVPPVQTVATTQDTASTPGPAITIFGNYNCQIDAVICASTSNGTSFNITAHAPGDSCSDSPITVAGLSPVSTLSGQAISLGCNLTMSFVALPASGNLFSFTAIAAKSAGTLKVGNQTFSFVAANPGPNQILAGTTAASTATNITAALNAQSNEVTATNPSAGLVNLTAILAGEIGNNIGLSFTPGSWASISQPMSGGTNAGLEPTTQGGAPDKPRNVVISLDFNEAINPIFVDSSTISVEYQDDGGAWQSVDGNYFVSNQFKTVEFLPDSACIDELTGQPIGNSCGDTIFCLPVNDPDPYEATRYRVTVTAGILAQCSVPADCSDPNFPICAATPGGSGSACQGSFNSVNFFYPESRSNPTGIVDVANNTFNGNSDTYQLNSQTLGKADGPGTQSGQAAFSLNNQDLAQGDDMVLEFYVNREIDLSPPVVELTRPIIGQSNTSLTSNLEAQFDSVMLSSTLKPGNNYRDGLCGCSDNNDCSSTEICDPIVSVCVAQDGQQQLYCEQDSECNTNVCVNKKYVSLLNNSITGVGWWISKDDLDTIIPLDGYGDKTEVNLEHTRFGASTNYGAELGSGVKDIYQNCYIPSAGSDGSSGSCDATDQLPYCCNGVAMNETTWQSSSCFTGF